MSLLPSKPENQLASCWPRTLGVKLDTLSAPSLLGCGVCGPWEKLLCTVSPRARRVGVNLLLLLLALRGCRDTDVDVDLRLR